MLMQNFGGTNKEQYGMYGIFCSGQLGRVELTFAKTSGAVTGDRENSQSV